MYGHVWVVLGLLATHPTWGVVALPLLARLYVRVKELAGISRAADPDTARQDMYTVCERLISGLTA